MRTQIPSGNITSQLHVLQYVTYGGVILYFGQAFFIPLSFAVLISFILYPICEWLEARSFKRLTAILICMALLTGLLISIITLLVQQFMSFLSEWPAFKVKLLESVNQISLYLLDTFTISKEQQNEWLKHTMDQSGSDIFIFIKQTIAAYAFTAVLFILIPIFSTLILYYRKRLGQTFYKLFPIEKRVDVKNILELTIIAYYNFIKGMLIVYFVVGALNSIGLLALGVPHAIFFGYVAAILTFIPYVGILVGSLLPITISWITYNSVWYPIGVILVFTFVQYLEANIIFPIAVSNKLKINALATLCAIIIGGLFWGIAGMILFVPFLAITKLIVDKYPGLKKWSILLGTQRLD